jgi:hypothetical protein
MGFLRKATFVATGGASGLVLKANSKKERAARAAEQQAKIMKRAANDDDTQYLQPIVHDDDPGVVKLSLSAELANLAELRDQGILSEEEFAACKAKLLA